jgi:L-ribulose-5-phosphate 4-epimerase
MASFKELKRAAYEANLELPRRGLVLYTFGNVSAIDRNRGVVAIKPSGIGYDALTPESMVLVDLEGKTLSNGPRPSTDTKTHLVLYESFPGIGGVAHTHSTFATAWAQAMLSIPCLGTTHADHLPGEIPCTAPVSDAGIRKDYEDATGRCIVAAFKNRSPDETPMVLVACHGPFTWGADAAKAAYHSVVLEDLAKTALLTRVLNPSVRPLRRGLRDKHFFRKHGADAYYGQTTT